MERDGNRTVNFNSKTRNLIWPLLCFNPTPYPSPKKEGGHDIRRDVGASSPLLFRGGVGGGVETREESGEGLPNFNIMQSTFFKKYLWVAVLCALSLTGLRASSHREAPLIADDPLADNCDLYAFRSPDNPNTVTFIATYVPLQMPQGGPNYYSFGQNIRYEVHIDNDASKPGDEIVYRFTFTQVNEDPTTFFNIRLGKQNLKTVYKLERSMDGGATFTTIVAAGTVPPPNIGQRSIEGGAGLNTTYASLMANAVTTASSGEKVFCGTTDDPFFVDLGGVFDLGDLPRQTGKSVDGVACLNVSTIAIQVPISMLLKSGVAPTPANILDPNFVIGVWASASRPQIRTLSATGAPTYSGPWVQVSRLGMPLTNEAVIPVGSKDFWNAITPYQELADVTLDEYFYNPELGLYMDDSQFGGAVPAFKPLRIQSSSLQGFDFRNGKNGLFGLKGNVALAGTALDDAVFGTLLLPAAGKPRSVDLWPIFHTGVPNLRPYQLATGKNGNPLAAGKPFIHNFLPNGGDMLRLNMATPVTSRTDAKFSPLGIVQAAVLGLTDPAYNTNANLQNIPNMDGFPNGRRLEDDVTLIELQAVAGVTLAAIGLWYDDYTAGGPNPVTPKLLGVLTYNTGVSKNDRAFGTTFPYVAAPNAGTSDCGGKLITAAKDVFGNGIGLSQRPVLMKNYPNPFRNQTTFEFKVNQASDITVQIYDVQGKFVTTAYTGFQPEGEFKFDFNTSSLTPGMYMAQLFDGQGRLLQTGKLVKAE